MVTHVPKRDQGLNLSNLTRVQLQHCKNLDLKKKKPNFFFVCFLTCEISLVGWVFLKTNQTIQKRPTSNKPPTTTEHPKNQD